MPTPKQSRHGGSSPRTGSGRRGKRGPYGPRRPKTEPLPAVKTRRDELLDQIAATLGDYNEADLEKLLRIAHRAEAGRLARRAGELLGYPAERVAELSDELREMPIRGQNR